VSALRKLWRVRRFRKALVEQGLTLLVVLSGVVIGEAETIGLSAEALWVLSQVRRAARDAMAGQPE
jgi:hypothetical protein